MFHCFETKSFAGTRERVSGLVISGYQRTLEEAAGGASAALEILNDNTAPLLAQIFEPWSTGSQSNIANVGSLITNLDYYNTQSAILNNLRATEQSNEDFQGVRNLIATAFQGINVSVGTYGELQRVTNERDDYKEKADLLDKISSDPDAMTEYIEMLSKRRGGFRLFGGQTATAMSVSLKPEYAIYFTVYGVPNYGAFDPDKLATINARIEYVRNENPEITTQSLISNISTLLKSQDTS